MFEAFLTALLKHFSAAKMSVGVCCFIKASSVSSVNLVQSALRKLTKVLSSLGWRDILVEQEMMIGRWSEPREVLVDHVQ